MKKRMHYSDEPMDEIQVLPDFLPSPEELALKEENVKITIALSKESISFFKEMGEKHHTSYQKMIRRLLDSYVAQEKAKVG